MNFETILMAQEGPTALVTLNRPTALNAISLQLERELTSAIQALDADPAIRSIVLTGAGRAFSVGVDLKELSEPDGLNRRTWHGAGSLSATLAASSTPMICAVNGYAVTGGLELALHCDFIIASDAAQFADTHARVGITPSWGMTWRLAQVIGPARAKQMSLTGQYVGAATACDWGLANEITSPDALLSRAMGIAFEISETNKAAMTRIRRLMDDNAGGTAMEREAKIFDKHIKDLTPDDIAKNRMSAQARGRRVAGGAT
ncbi:MAG: enoyl-CoA hydratase [Pseudomonadota bacterium]